MNVTAVKKSSESPEARSTVRGELRTSAPSLHPASLFARCAPRTTGLGGAPVIHQAADTGSRDGLTCGPLRDAISVAHEKAGELLIERVWNADFYKTALESRPWHTRLQNLRAGVNLPVEGFQTQSEETVGDADLLAALDDLDDVVREARDEGFQTPSEETIGVAERLLRAMYELRRCRFEVYPTQDGDVAVSAPGGHGRSVIVVCDSEGGVLCSVNLNGQHRRAVYDSRSATALPDGFVQEALAALDA